mmetsp:Transcript_33038/g.46120  ORF Transcript_33038/g.46120 Transcript_33038/m.46120 type:complete len:93 (+) Transcript_33038:65-343(+)
MCDHSNSQQGHVTIIIPIISSSSSSSSTFVVLELLWTNCHSSHRTAHISHKCTPLPFPSSCAVPPSEAILQFLEEAAPASQPSMNTDPRAIA